MESTAAETKRWMTPSQLADYLQLSLETVYKKAQRGEIPGHKIGPRLWRFDRNEIEGWIKQNQAGG